IKVKYKRDGNETLYPFLVYGDSMETQIGYIGENNGEYMAESFIQKIPESWNQSTQLVAAVTHYGERNKYVVPMSSVFKEGEQTFIYVVYETRKAWGTEYILHKETVKVIESNGEYAALNSVPKYKILKNAKKSYYDGMLIKQVEGQW
ncbi:MAG: hypothetical protein Q4F11_06350, partial [Eubacteriales bacterium]|nr:hypothetical protein [Eubacteriales bacterium]